MDLRWHSVINKRLHIKLTSVGVV